MYPFELTIPLEIKNSSILALSEIEATIKSLEIVRRDEERFGDVTGYSFDDQVASMVHYYTTVDLETAHAALTSIEHNSTVLKEDLTALLRLASYGLNGVDPNGPLGQRAKNFFSKYRIPRDNTCFAVFPFPQLMYDDIKFRTAGPSLETQFNFFSGSKIYKNLKNKYGVPSLMAMLPSGQKYGGFVKAFLHVRYLQHGSSEVSFLDVLSRSRADYNSKLYANEERLEFFKKLPISEEDCLMWNVIFDMKMTRFKNIHKLFDQIA